MTGAEIQSTSWRIWIIFLLLGLLLHALLFWTSSGWLPAFAPSLPRPRMEVKQLSPEELEDIRSKWQSLAEPKKFLLDQGKKEGETDAPPEDARYFSDRNIRVEKERRAKNPAPVPGKKRGGTKKDPGRQADRKASPRNQTTLSNLGVPIAGVTKPAEESPPAGGAAGGEQTLTDENLPEGEENLLNAIQSVHYSFFKRIFEAVNPNWQSRMRSLALQKSPAPGRYEIVYEIVLDPQGKVMELNLLHSSGVNAFDEVAREVLDRLGELRNPPSALVDTDGMIRIPLLFSVDVGSGGFGAPQGRIRRIR